MTGPTHRSTGIDLLRGVAVGLVMLRHAAPALVPGAGVVGVVMFFTLSGYLITGVLAAELTATGRVDLARFYRRRAARLVPALLVVVAGVVVVTLVLDPLDDRAELGRTVLFALTWTGNLPFGHASEATFHLWTLATEEQFYLLWPLLLVVAWRAGRVPAAVLGAAVLCVAACAATVVRLADAPDLAYSLPTSWAVCFVIGGALRLGCSAVPTPPQQPWLSWAARAALVGLGLLSVVELRGHALTYVAGGPVIAILTGVLVLAWRTQDAGPSRRSGPSGPSASSALRGLVWLGTISYAAYLWNYPLTLWLRAAVPDGTDHDAVTAVLAVALTLALAAASTRWVEQPVLRLRERRDVARAVST